MTGQHKIDDEDGHYIVTPDTDLGDRCKSLHHLHIQCKSTFLVVITANAIQTKLLDYWAKARSER